MAAIGQYVDRQIIIAASDRMVTTGDIEFEQEQRKIIFLTNSVAVMVAGDLTVQTAIIHQINAWVREQVDQDPDAWLLVREVADHFYDCLSEIRKEAARNAILAPLDLNFKSLVSRDISSELSMQLSKEILGFDLAPIEAIVMGIDPSGTHLYIVDNRGTTCQDWVGFAAIGAGAWHANSQLMFAGHVKTRQLAETTMLIYTAKRRAEVAPGVGEETDMVMMGPALGDIVNVGPALLELLAGTFKEVQQQAEKVRQDANQKIDEFLESSVGEAAVHPQVVEPYKVEAPDAEVRDTDSPARANFDPIEEGAR